MPHPTHEQKPSSASRKVENAYQRTLEAWRPAWEEPLTAGFHPARLDPGTEP